MSQNAVKVVDGTLMPVLVSEQPTHAQATHAMHEVVVVGVGRLGDFALKPAL